MWTLVFELGIAAIPKHAELADTMSRQKKSGKKLISIWCEQAWSSAMEVAAKIVSVTSFNEWHEGTQIEPAVPMRCICWEMQNWID